MDEMYVMRHERQNSGRLSHRRCHAEQQWLQTRADADYMSACAVADEHKTDYLAFHTVQMRTLVPRVCVPAATPLFHTTLMISPAKVRIEDLPLCLTKDPDSLTRSIVGLDRESLMHVLVSFDPLAWMCSKHLERHQWFMHQQYHGMPDDLQPEKTPELFFLVRTRTPKKNEVDFKPLFQKRQLDDIAKHTIVPRQRVLVTTDTISWPVRRRICFDQKSPTAEDYEMNPSKRFRTV